MSKTPDEYLNINQRAQLKFSKLKQKMKLDLGIPLIEQAIIEGTGKHIKVDREKIESLLKGEIKTIPELEQYTANVTPTNSYSELAKVGYEVDEMFAFIDSLELDPKLSLAIGMIISYKNTKNVIDLQKAIESLEGEINGRR